MAASKNQDRESTRENKDLLESTARLLQDKIIDAERTLSCAVQSISTSQISRFNRIDNEIVNLREASQSSSSALSEASQCLSATQAGLESLNRQLQISHRNLQRSSEEASRVGVLDFNVAINPS